MKKLLIVLIFSFCLISGSEVYNSEDHSSVSKFNNTHNSLIDSYVTHGPIEIDNDEGFINYGFPGLGTTENPYLIENYLIVTSAQYGISIWNTSKFFIILNCYIEASRVGITISDCISWGTVSVMNNSCVSSEFDGISLRECSGAIVANNSCSSNINGIEILNSSNVTLSNNNCFNNINHGIFIFESPENRLSSNNCSNNFNAGILLYSSSRSTVTNNTCKYNNWHGIWLKYSTGTTVTNNTCTKNSFAGTLLSYSSRVNLANNTCEFNDNGMRLDSADHCVLTNNLFERNQDYGLYINYASDVNIIHHNTFIDNNFGGYSQACDDGTENIWFDEETEEGNYWSDWHMEMPYPIDGTAEANDPFPSVEYLETPTIKTINYSFSLLILSLLALTVLSTKQFFKHK